MEKLITALDNKFINLKLRALNKYEINYDDISYQEGVIEIIEKEQIDIILLSESLDGPYEIKEFIKKIKKINNNINIILFLEKKNEILEKFLIENNIYNYFYNNELSRNNFYKKFLNISIKNKQEFNEIKELILKKKNKINKKLKNYFINKNYLKINKKTILLSICGKDSLEKSIFCLMLSSILEKQRKKVLIIDFDILNENLNTLFGVNKFPNKKNSNNKIIKINNYINVYSGLNLINNNNDNIMKKINILKNSYDYVLFNLSSECNMILSKEIINNSKFCLFLFNDNIIDFNFNKNLLNIYKNKWNINNEKFICILNIEKNIKISRKIINDIFNNYKVILNFNIKNCKHNNLRKKDFYNILKIINNKYI